MKASEAKNFAQILHTFDSLIKLTEVCKKWGGFWSLCAKSFAHMRNYDHNFATLTQAFPLFCETRRSVQKFLHAQRGRFFVFAGTRKNSCKKPTFVSFCVYSKFKSFLKFGVGAIKKRALQKCECLIMREGSQYCHEAFSLLERHVNMLG